MNRLVKHVSGCDRVYAIAFGEGARHLHLHLIPRCNGIPETEAWAVADLYRDDRLLVRDRKTSNKAVRGHHDLSSIID